MLRKTAVLIVLNLGLLALVSRQENAVLGAPKDSLPSESGAIKPFIPTIFVQKGLTVVPEGNGNYRCTLKAQLTVMVRGKQIPVDPISESCILSKTTPDITNWHGSVEDNKGHVVRFQLKEHDKDHQFEASCRWWALRFIGDGFSCSKILTDK